MSDLPQGGGDGWREYQRLVLAKLEDNARGVEALRAELSHMRIEVVTLKTKASVWGAVAGTIVGTIVAIVTRVLRG